MFRRHWSLGELLPRVDLISYILRQNKHITAVGLTGSGARRERIIHDADLVLFTDGTMEDGSAQDPERTEPYYNDDIFLHDIVSQPEASRALTHARMGMPVNYIVVGEHVLWDCRYIRSLEAKEKFSEFYLRVFCDIPLLLLNPYYRRGEMRERIKCHTGTVIWLERGLPMKRGYHAVVIKHQCDGSFPQLCGPKQPWDQCKRKIQLRKKCYCRYLPTFLGGR